MSEVKNKASEAKNDAVSSAKNQACSAAGIPGDDMPSPDGVVWRWTGKENTFGQIGERLIFTGDRKSDSYKEQVFRHMAIFKEVLTRLGSTEAYGLIEYLTSEDKKTCAPIDEIPRYAWTKAFVDNPTLDNFKVFAMAMLYDSPNYMIYLQYPMSNGTKGIVNADKGWLLAWPSETEMITERRAREEYAIELAKKKITLKDICEYALMQYQRAEAAVQQGNPSLAHGYFVAERLKEKLIDEHPDYNSSADCVRQVEAEAAKWDANNRAMYVSMIEACTVNSAKPVDVPAGVSVSADIKSNGDAAGKKWAAAKKLEYVKTIYLGNQWHTFKNPKYPYNVTHYALKAAVICKMGDKYVMQKMDLQKSLQGQYSMVPGLGENLTPVNYK